jgi:hypothetical protein
MPLGLRHVLWLAALSACATGVQQDFVDDDNSSGGGQNTGGALMAPSEAGTSTTIPTAGSTGAGGAGNPFGGSAGSGGKASAGSGGMAGQGGASAGSGGASAGSGGASAGSGGASAGSGGGTSCGCLATKVWTDNANISFTTNDCLTVGTATYKYVGTKAQTYANIQCNPSMQQTWCTDSGNDYKFMLCP